MPLLSLLNLEHTTVSCQCRGASVSFRLCRIVALGYNGAFNAARCRVMAVISYALPPSPSAPCSSNSIPSLAQPLRPPTLAHRPPHTPNQSNTLCLVMYVSMGGRRAFHLGYGVDLCGLEVLHPLPPFFPPALLRLTSIAPPSHSPLLAPRLSPFPPVAHSPNIRNTMSLLV